MVERHRHFIQSACVGVFGQREFVRVVGCEHKQRMLKPRLPACRQKELPERMVGITYRLVDGFATFREHTLILLRHFVGMMAGCSEHGGHERLLHRRHRLGVILQERLIPNRPCSVKRTIVAELVHPVIALETRTARIRLKAHATVRCAVKERRLIANSVQTIGNG